MSHFESFPHFHGANVFNPLLHCFAGREVAIRRPGKEGATTGGDPRMSRGITEDRRVLAGRFLENSAIQDVFMILAVAFPRLTGAARAGRLVCSDIPARQHLAARSPS